MDVSIAVSLIRGQMGAVVEQAVNGAVETVLAEMLKVVGVKFEELKAQVALMKRDVVALQREKALKEKENDNIRAKLRYTELKLKYYRQGVEEELQQRASASTLVRIHQSTFPPVEGISCTEASSSSSLTQTGAAEGPLARSHQECNPLLSVCKVQGKSDVHVASSNESDLLLSVSTVTESLDSSTGLLCPTQQDVSLSKDEEQDVDCVWTVTVQPRTEGIDTTAIPPPVQSLTLEEQPTTASCLSPSGRSQADRSTLPVSVLQVKKEAQQHEEEEHIICIKEEPDEEQEVMASLLLDTQMKHSHVPESEAQISAGEWAELHASQRHCTTGFSSPGQGSYTIPQSEPPLPSVAAMPPGVPPRQVMHLWTKDLSLYEEYKLRRNELRRRSLNRRRELEKTLPQPLLADLVRERREKTRLRVARWRAKRKLQACLNQAQDGAADHCQTTFLISRQQQQQLRMPCASTSSSHSNTTAGANISAAPPFITPSPPPLLMRGPGMASSQHPVTSLSPSCSFPQGSTT